MPSQNKEIRFPEQKYKNNPILAKKNHFNTKIHFDRQWLLKYERESQIGPKYKAWKQYLKIMLQEHFYVLNVFTVQSTGGVATTPTCKL